MNIVRVKSGVRFDRIAPAGFVIIAAAHSATRVCCVDVMITCGTEAHPPTDPHTLGEAYDLSTVNFSVELLLKVRSYFQNALGPLFTVLYESPFKPADPRLAAIATINPDATGPHLHIQRRKGTTYPPPPPATTAV